MLEPLLQSLHQMPLVAARLAAWWLLLAAVFIPVERLFAIRRSRVFRREFGIDVGYYFLNGILPGLVLATPLAIVAWIGHQSFTATLFIHAPLAVRLGLTLILAEVGFYWGHRLSHEIPLLWRFHAVHHSAEHVDWLVNARGHPVDFIVTRMCGFFPVYLLGLTNPLEGQGTRIAAIVMLIGPLWGYFIHANVRWRFGPLEWLIASPAFHHWHHTNDGPRVINKNYAPMFPWIDRVFGSHYLPKDKLPATYGTDTAVSSKMGGQLLDPFVPPEAQR